MGGQPADEQPVGPASVVRVRPRALTEPARRALAAQRWRAPVTAVFARSFNVTAAGLVVNVASHPLDGVCQVQAAGAIGVRPGAMVAFEASERAVDVGLASTGRVPAGTSSPSVLSETCGRAARRAPAGTSHRAVLPSPAA